jgi:hypothetical protein
MVPCNSPCSTGSIRAYRSWIPRRGRRCIIEPPERRARGREGQRPQGQVLDGHRARHPAGRLQPGDHRHRLHPLMGPMSTLPNSVLEPRLRRRPRIPRHPVRLRGGDGHRLYSLRYGSGPLAPYSVGKLGKDRLRLTLAAQDRDVVDGFGCSEDVNFDGLEAGIVGLGNDRLSFVNQVAAARQTSAFSYCFFLVTVTRRGSCPSARTPGQTA